MNKKKPNEIYKSDTVKIPEFVYESLVRSLLPVIQKYYESEGKRTFAEWKRRNPWRKATLHKNNGRIAMPAVLPFCVCQSSISSI